MEPSRTEEPHRADPPASAAAIVGRVDTGVCAACARRLEPGRAFRFQTQAGPVVKCGGCAVRHPPMLRRSLGIAAVIGTVLVLINQGDGFLAGRWAVALVWKVPLTYAVPFLVATWSALLNGRARL